MKSAHKRFDPVIFLRLLAGAAVVALPINALADGTVIDKVYHPYVQPLETEIELRSIIQNDDDEVLDGVETHRLGLGRSWSDRWFTEIYLIGAKTNEDSFALKAYELEAKWQLTEQGEFWADWGLLFELEVGHDDDIWEYGTTVLVEKEWGNWVTTVNTGLVYEWGDDIENEWETLVSIQSRYRLGRAFEPALEFYGGQDTKGLGPVFLGDVRFSGKRKLRWEAGVIFGLDSDTADQTFRAMLEYEF
jgi:hypothetical protein